ncbi:hypothetical protein EYR36_006989 [Pleurotus pulmonarius]|nr:hypothetical protein EYR36_006989 [Pleurotus pulmonarius]
MSQLPDFALAFDDRQPLFILRKSSLIGLWLATLLYGIYVILFGISVYIFWTAGKARNPLLQLSAVFMFSLSTAHMILDIVTTLGMNLETGTYLRPTAIAAVYLHLTNSAIADSVIIYRCYIVWGFNKYFILPIILVITTTVYGYTMGLSVGTISISLATNIIVTGLTAGRLWWGGRKTAAILGPHHIDKYARATSIVLESGAIYSLSLLVFLILSRIELGTRRSVPANSYACELPHSYVIYLAVSQLVGIIPTLIIVRVGLNLRPDHETMSGLHFHSRAMSPGRPLNIALTTEVTSDRVSEVEGEKVQSESAP